MKSKYGVLICIKYDLRQFMPRWGMLESPTYTVQYVAEGDTVAENYGSALGALGRIQMLMEYGVGYGYAIYVDKRLLMDQAAIFENLKIRHN